MANPVAAHTFDFVRTYLSTRTSGVPGSGVWTNPITIVDGTLNANFKTGSTFSAGALDSVEPKGIVVTSLDAALVNRLVFCGDGLPTVPIEITFAGQIGGRTLSSDYWDTAQGAWYYLGAYYLAVQNGGGINPPVILKSVDAGATWVIQDDSNGPTGSGADGSLASIQRVGNKLCIFAPINSGDVDFAIWEFDFTTDKWGASFAPINIPNFGVFAQSNGDNWVNSLFKFPNGDFAVIYQEISGSRNVVYRLWSASSARWGATLTIPSSTIGYANSAMDPGLGSIHIITYTGGNIGQELNYHTITHPGSVLTTILNAIPAVVTSSSDGVGHCSIQNGMLFVPRDDSNDFDNAVWVADLPVTSFLKELLPIPPGETDELLSVAVGAGGAGYTPGDILTLIGGIYPATVLVATILAGAVATVTIHNRGGGYSVASGVPTTGGTGTGATIDIISVQGKTPSCAYMMFPNGYALTGPAPGTCPITINPGGSGSGPCVNPGTNPSLDSYLELRKVLVAWKKETHLPIRGKS